MKKLLMFCSILLMSKMSFAGFMAEPYIGYSSGKVDTAPTEVKITGVNVGARLGYQFLMPWVALDVKQMISGKDDMTPSNDVTGTDLGVTVGASLPIVRPYAGYIFSSKATLKGSGTSTDLEGKGYKLGVGFGILPLVHINLEYSAIEIDKMAGVDLTTKLKYTPLMLAVSYVF